METSQAPNRAQQQQAQEKDRRNPEQLHLDLFADAARWPRKPYCSDDKTARHIRSLSAALRRQYIQANPPHLRVWSIFDVDRERGGNASAGALAWEVGNLPPPSWACASKESGNAHLVWGLAAPVLVDSPDMRQRPLRYLCAVEAAFRERLNADSGYAGLMTKNPAHPIWRTLRGPVPHYDLAYMAEWVDLPKHLPKRNPEEIGIGRNVVVFDWLRHYAYRNIKRYRAAGERNFVLWQSHLNNKALERNGDLQVPMAGNEVWAITKSVCRWTWSKFDIAASDSKFSQMQAHRGRRGGIAKGLANEDKKASARLMYAAGYSTREAADELKVNQSTIVRWFNTFA